MIGKNMSNIEAAADFKRPGPDGYVVKIERVHNDEAKERLDIMFDIAEGEFAGYIKETNDKFGFWSAKATKSYKETALPFFRAFIEAVVASNPDASGLVIGNYDDVDETKLVGLVVGAAVGEREYDGNDGKRKRVLDWYNANYVPVSDIRSGNFTIPETRIADGNASQPVKVTDGFDAIKDQDVPF